MKELHVETIIRACRPDELPAEERALAEAACRAAERGYAPYSHFQVGAAVMLADGTVVTGSNQENAAYPSGLCAERVALFQANHRFPDVPVKALAIAAVSGGRQTGSISPCGACRQVMLETEQRYGKHIKVLMCGAEEVLTVGSAEALLPLCFGVGSF